MVAPLILAPLGPKLTPDEVGFFNQASPWAFILFARNLETPAQIRRLCDDLRDSVGRDAPVLIDQEGGRVQRLRPPLARDWLPPLEDVARLGAQAARGMYLRYRIIAAELLALGIDVNCAPTLDIASSETHPFLRNRCLGEEAAQVSALGQAIAGAHLDGGVLPVIKHLPGHGRAQVDSHAHLPRTDAPREALSAEDFAPFAALSEMPLGMTGHIIFDALDAERPSTQSPEVIALIRDQIGFGGLLMTDDISMNALSGDVAERGAKSWAAGCDLVLHCNGEMAEMERLAETAPRLSPETRKRANKALAARVTPAPVDLAALIAEYEGL